jgi:hypothetical protein
LKVIEPTGSRFLWSFAALFVILGIGYSILTPLFENSDETLHYPYVKHLADGKGLPLAVPGQLWNQEGTQPPLYYAIVAASTFWIDSDNLLDHLQRNPHWLFSKVRAVINDNQNLVLHGPMDTFPYRRAALAIHIGRWWSLAFGLVTVICTFFIAQYLFPHNLSLTLMATALTALNPQFIRVSATVSNDSLSAALTTLAVLAALKVTDPAWGAERADKQERRQNVSLLFLGLLCGLALLTKLSSLSTLFIVAFILFLRLFSPGKSRRTPARIVVRWLVTIGVFTLILNGWWFWRNYQLYGEWLATKTHLNLAGHGDLSLTAIWKLRAEIERAYWATFGWGQIRPPEWVYQILFWFSRIGLVGLLLIMLAKLVQIVRSRSLVLNLGYLNFEGVIILIFWAGMNVALYLRWVMAVGSVSHTRLMFPAIAAVSLLLALGWHTLLPYKAARWFSSGVVVAFVVLNVYSLGWLIYPAFRPTDGLEDFVLRNQSNDGEIGESSAETIGKFDSTSLDLSFLDSMRLTEGRVYPQHLASRLPKIDRYANQGDVVMVEVGWQILRSMDKNYSVAAVLLAPDGSVLAQRETYPGLGLRPTSYLQPGQTFDDAYPLKLKQTVSDPIVAHAVVNLFDNDSEPKIGLPALAKNGTTVTPNVGYIKITPQPWPNYQPDYPVDIRFAESIALIGYDINDDYQAEESASPMPALVLYWKSLIPVDKNLVVFLHMVDTNGNVIAQADAPPTNNTYPTSWWAPGEVIADRHSLPNLSEIVTVRLGLYQLDSGQRLPVVDSTLPYQDDAVEIRLP